MFISTEEEQIALSPNNAKHSLISPPMGSISGSLDGSSPVSDSRDLAPVIADVNVVPEHLKMELEQSIANLEGTIFQVSSVICSKM